MHPREAGPHKVEILLEDEALNESALGEQWVHMSPAGTGERPVGFIAFNIAEMPIHSYGRHVLRLFVDGLEVMELAFEVELSQLFPSGAK